MSRMRKWARRGVLAGALTLLAGLAQPALAGEGQCRQDGDRPQLTAAYGQYMVYYKKPGWSRWKVCGPYSYAKACDVADDLEDQGCDVRIKRAR